MNSNGDVYPTNSAATPHTSHALANEMATTPLSPDTAEPFAPHWESHWIDLGGEG